MTQPELILKLVEMIISEKDKVNEIQSKLEEYQKGKD